MKNAILALAFATHAWAGIDNATCEPVSAGVYRLTFEASGGPVELFVDGSPEQIKAAGPLAVVQSSPAEVRVAEPKGRLYFHLKQKRGGAVRTVSTRQLPLEGAANFRDLGGYRTSDGQSVKWGKVYRSNNLAGLTDGDYQYLRSIGLRLVCDVRTEFERTRQPTRWQGPAPDFLLTPIGSEALIRSASSSFDPKNKAASQTSLVSETRGYEQFITEYAGEYDKVFHRLLAADGLPLVLHCSAGRDRTGMFAAMLLTMLGVPRETVVDDYLLTGKYLLSDSAVQKMATDIQKSMGLSAPPDIAYLKERLEMKRAVMDSSFQVIDEHYGSFENFRREKLHISDDELVRMKALLLER